MRRFFLIPLLAFGTIAGYAHGFHALRSGAYGCHSGCAWSQQYRGDDAPVAAPSTVNVQQAAPAAAPAPAPVTVQQTVPAGQTLVIPIIVGVPAQLPTAAAPAPVAPTTIVIPSQQAPAAPAAPAAK